MAFVGAEKFLEIYITLFGKQVQGQVGRQTRERQLYTQCTVAQEAGAEYPTLYLVTRSYLVFHR